MEVLEVKKGKIVLELSEHEYDTLMRAGLQKLADEQTEGKVKILPPECAMDNCKQIEVSDDFCNLLVREACISAIERMMEKVEG